VLLELDLEFIYFEHAGVQLFFHVNEQKLNRLADNLQVAFVLSRSLVAGLDFRRKLLNTLERSKHLVSHIRVHLVLGLQLFLKSQIFSDLRDVSADQHLARTVAVEDILL
jgi:hypothetical protein